MVEGEVKGEVKGEVEMERDGGRRAESGGDRRGGTGWWKER